MQESSRSIAMLDTLLSLANVAVENNYVKPTITKDNIIDIVDGRHPIVEAILSSDEFVPNNTNLNNNDCRTMIITGPNMAGKSTYMRQVALICFMAHIGSFVPAKSATIGLIDRIFTRVGASDDLSFGQSTFMVEMVEVSNILKNATNNSLIILDEVGRGTSTFDGLSIAWSVMDYISKHMLAKTLFSTHYHELTQLEGILDGVKNYQISVKEFNNSVIFLRKIVRGGANRSFGIEVAELAGVSKEVTERAKNFLKKLEKSDITKSKKTEVETESVVSLSEIERIVLDLDLNNVSPMQAFNILNDLYEKVKNK
jgi:DNA mismatch repair protein MutS